MRKYFIPIIFAALISTVSIPTMQAFAGPGFCSDGILDPGEQCDDGNTIDGDSCSAVCLVEFCGDDTVNDSGTEQCDDGNTESFDGCSAICKKEGAKCGNGFLDRGEGCDIPNTPGCNNFCLLTGAVNQSLCGNNVLEPSNGEACDLGSFINESFIFINHFKFRQESNYGVRLGSGIRDSFQNCYLPCADDMSCIRAPAPGSLIGWAEGVPWTPPGAFPSCFLP